jgi:CDP-diacylglycerol--glycerol-3-phosphate 3-phosphatidyltransferase
LDFKFIPLVLTVLRVMLGPVVVVLAFWSPMPWAFAVCLIVAFLSDVFDGVIARKLGIATAFLRRMDSIADSVFYLCALFAAWYLHSDILKPHLFLLSILAGIELARYCFDLYKFGKEASYHMWSSKFWGVTLLVAFMCVLVQEAGGWPIALTLYAGIVADIEGLLISMILKQWRTDVPTLFHAYKLSRN